MRSLYRVIKSGQTVLGEGRVPAYQMTGPETAQAEEISGEPGNAAREAADGAVPRYALISEEKRKILEHARNQAEQSAARILELEEYSEEIKARITEMALVIAEKILQREVGAGAEGLADLVEQAVMSERDKNEITVHLSDDSIALVEELERRLEPLRDRNGGYVRIRPEQQQPGYVQIETEEGIVDASVFVQLENLKRQLAELLK